MSKKLAYALLAFNALLIGTQASANEMPKCLAIAGNAVEQSFPGAFTQGAERIRDLQNIVCRAAHSSRADAQICTMQAIGEGQATVDFLVVVSNGCNGVITALALK